MTDLRSHRLRTWCLAALALAFTSASVAWGAPRWQVPDKAPAVLPASGGQPAAALFEGAASTDDGRIQLFVELEQPSGAEAFAAAMRGGSPGDPQRRQRAGQESRRAVGLARAEQATMAGLLHAAGVRELYRTARAINGIAVAIEPTRAKDLLAIPGVRRVLPIYAEYPENSTSVPFLGTPHVWDNTTTPALPAGADGTGITIGIIDTGTDYMHADFDGPNLDIGNPQGQLTDYQAEAGLSSVFTTAGSFPTTTVVGGTDFAGDTYTGGNTPAPDPNPMDCNGHGSHVSGTAAGLGVTSAGATYTGPWDSAENYAALRIGPGTAPKASIYALRVFGCTGSTGLTTLAIDWAMDPNNDDDLSDHLDVINMSLGSNFGSALSASAVASDNAALAGVIVVTSAGNAGDTFFISGSPGSASHALATAASLDSGQPATVSVKVNPPAAIANTYAGGTAAFGTVPNGETADAVIAVDATNTVPAPGCGADANDGCCALTNNDGNPGSMPMTGKICVVNRGTCSFKTKTRNCMNAGAIGVVLANNAAGAAPGLGDDATIVDVITIPTVSVSQADGNTIKTAINSAPTPPINITLLGTNGADTLASFSSRGPRRIFGSPLRLKPDIAAPGFNISSVHTGHTCTGPATSTACTGTSDPSGYTPGNRALTISGTSMASPHMAGVMALLRQLNPTWSVDELKALAMNYALNDVTQLPNATPPRYGPSRTGGGRVDPQKAALGEVVAMDADNPGVTSVAFDPQVVVSGPLTQTRKVRVINKGLSDQTYDLAIDTVVDSPGVAFSLVGPSSVTVPAGGQAEIVVQMTATPASMNHTRDATLAATQSVQVNFGAQPRNFLTEEGGYLTFSQSSNVKLRLPVYMAERPAATMHATGPIATSGSPSGSTSIALAGTHICTGALGAGPQCTGTFPTTVESLVSPFELQVVSPLDPVNSTDYGDIRYVGVSYLPNADGQGAGYQHDLMMFGVASWGDWSTPNDVAYDICIDNDNDGDYEKIIYNSNPAIFVSGASFNDNFVRLVRDTPTTSNSILGLGSPVNLLQPSTVDSALHLNNVMMLAATPEMLGYTSSAVTTIKYKVYTCPGSSPICARTSTGDHCSPAPGTYFDVAAGPFTYNWAAQGLNFGGNFLDDDLNGGTLPVSFDTANMTANGSVGALLLHHHNGRGNRAEVVPLDSAPTADLAITKTVSPITQTVGGSVTFTLTVTNNGPAAATGVTVNDFVPIVTPAQPGDFSYVSDDGAGAYVQATGVWTIGALPASSSATLHITATVVHTSACNTATITGGSPLDSHAGDNQATACIGNYADLRVTLGATPATTNPGSSLSFPFAVQNLGVGDSTNVALGVSHTAPLADPTASGPGNPSAGSYAPGNPGTWTVGGLGALHQETLTLGATAPDSACSVSVTATATQDPTDPNPADNTVNRSVLVLSPANIDVHTKTVSGLFAPGGTVTYTVTLHNAGSYKQQDETGDEFDDTLPGTLTLVSANDGADPGTIGTAGNTVTWNGAIPSGGTVTITIVATIGAGVTPGTVISNQGTVHVDQDGDFNTADTDVPTDDPAVVGAADATSFTVRAAELEISKTDGITTAVPGQQVTYTIIGHNNTLSTATGVQMKDAFPAALDCSTSIAHPTNGWTCVASPGSDCDTGTGGTGSAGSGNINEHDVDLASNGSVTYTVNCTILPSASGSVVNTATIHDPPGGPTSATDTDTLTPQADVSITKTDGVTKVTAGGSKTYTITASNAGPSDAPSADVADTFPASLTCNWTCVASAGGDCDTTALGTGDSGSGSINELDVLIPADGNVTYTATCSIASTATGTLGNTATVTGNVTETNPGNESATDTDTIDLSADLSVTKTDGVTQVTAGGSTTYTITASNAGPSDAPGSNVSDSFPASLTCTWTCLGAGGGTCTASGSGDIYDTVGLPAGGSVTYTASCTISALATGTLDNTATVATAGAVTDPTPGNDSATDSDTIQAAADVSVTKTDGVTSVNAGAQTTYTIVVANAGPSAAPSTGFADTFPAACSTVSWTSSTSTGVTGSAGAGAGNISETLSLPASSSITYTAVCTVDPATPAGIGALANTATATPSVSDANSGNDSATDTDDVTTSADLAITKTDGVINATPGANTTYTIVVTNNGPSNSGGTVADTFPAECVSPSYTSVAAGSATGNTTAGAGNINDVLTLPAGGSVTYTVTCPVDAAATGSFANTATITPTSVSDPVAGNNSATDEDQAGNLIFSDGFESGTTTPMWDGTTP
jgi:uncharacterized repeat protein (TIGR01451 family)